MLHNIKSVRKKCAREVFFRRATSKNGVQELLTVISVMGDSPKDTWSVDTILTIRKILLWIFILVQDQALFS